MTRATGACLMRCLPTVAAVCSLGLAGLSPARAHETPVQGDVVRAIALPNGHLMLPEVPKWHTHRTNSAGLGKVIEIGPMSKPGGYPGPPTIMIQVPTRQIANPATFHADEVRTRERTSPGVYTFPAKGWRTVAGVKCPTITLVGKTGNTVIKTLWVKNGAEATLSFICPTPIFKAQKGHYDQFLTKIRFQP